MRTDISQSRTQLMFSFDAGINSVSGVRMIIDTPDTTAETQVCPNLLVTGIGTSTDIDIQMSNGIKIQSAFHKSLTQSPDGSLWQTDTQTTGVSTGTRRQIVDDCRQVHRKSQLFQQPISIRKISLWDIPQLHILTSGKSNGIITKSRSKVCQCQEHIRRVVAMHKRYHQRIQSLLFLFHCIPRTPDGITSITLPDFGSKGRCSGFKVE